MGSGAQAVWLQGKQGGGLRACGSLSPELEVDGCFVSGETVPHGVTCLSLLSSPWRPWGPSKGTTPRGPRPREERGGHDFWLRFPPPPTDGFPPAGSSVFQKFLLVPVTSYSGLTQLSFGDLRAGPCPGLGLWDLREDHTPVMQGSGRSLHRRAPSGLWMGAGAGGRVLGQVASRPCQFSSWPGSSCGLSTWCPA